MLLHFFDAVEVIPPKPFRADSRVVSLDIGVLLRLARLNVDQADSNLLRPVLKTTADLFGAVVQANGEGFSAPGNDLVQGPDNAFRR